MNKKILLVEDYPANILVMTLLLEEMGHVCDVAQTGEEAVEKVKTSNYHLLLMDLNLPRMDGFLACQEIRRLELISQRPAMPIIGLSADVNDHARARSVDVGMNHLLERTLNPDDMCRMIERYAA